MRKVLITATVQSHIAQFHIPLIKLLKNNGYEVHIAARNNLNEKNGLNIKYADKIFDIPFDRSPLSKSNVKAYKKLKQIILDNNYEIVHCNTPMGGVITRLAAMSKRKEGLLVFYTAHGFHFYKGSPILNWLLYYPIEKYLSYITDKLITINDEDYKLACRKFKNEIFYIHGVGVNNKKFYPYSIEKIKRLRSELGYCSNDILLLCIGELNNNKNQKTVIKAISEVKKEIPNIKLLLAGNGPNEKDLRYTLQSLNLEKNVEFLGYRTDLEIFINISNIIISASYREGLPLNVMEALLCKKPVIASINRGHKELTLTSFHNKLISPLDVEGFKNNIVNYCLNFEGARDKTNQMFKNIDDYTVDNVIRELSEIYELNG